MPPPRRNDPGLHPGLCCVGLSALKARFGGPKGRDNIARGEAPGPSGKEEVS